MDAAADLKLCRRLSRAILESGEAGIAVLRPALEKVLAGRSAAAKRQFLKQFHRVIVRELAKDTLTIESVDGLAAGQLDTLLERYASGHGRPVHSVEVVNPDLIAGLRVRLGDTVWDASVQGQLNTLTQRLR